MCSPGEDDDILCVSGLLPQAAGHGLSENTPQSSRGLRENIAIENVPVAIISYAFI